jgi:hypothetical protein
MIALEAPGWRGATKAHNQQTQFLGGGSGKV